MLVSSTVVDFSKKEDYVLSLMERVKLGDINNAKTLLQNTHVTLLDSVYDPFGTPTDELKFLNNHGTREWFFMREDDG